MKRTFNPSKVSKAMLVACKMPALRHKTDKAFDISKSEVVDWLSAQPEIRQALFDRYHDSGCILFDPDSKTWKGKDS